MKIIDLLNKISNEEEVPYRIKYNGRIYEYADEIKWYLRDDIKCELSNSKKCLNEEVEIIEDMNNEIKEILHKWNKVCNKELEFIGLTLEQMKQLYDYITNLEEDLKYYKEMEEEYNIKHTKLMNKCKKIREYLEEPNRDNFDYSKAEILEILEGDDIN